MWRCTRAKAARSASQTVVIGGLAAEAAFSSGQTDLLGAVKKFLKNSVD